MTGESMKQLRDVVEEGDLEVPDLLNPEVATMDLVRRLPEWECARCGEAMRGHRPTPDLCERCEEKVDRERRRTISRADVFKPTRIPHKHRSPPPWEADSWPRDPRKGASAICPASDWPDLAAMLVTDPAKTGPRSVVLTGANDAGKSHRAAELVFLLHRAGTFGATWIHESELLAEMDYAAWMPRPMEHAGKEAPVLVVDDVFSHRGGPASVEAAAGLILNLAERRWANPYKVTIWTTHRFISSRSAWKSGLTTEELKAQAEEKALPPDVLAAAKERSRDSVESLAPAVLGRWRDGLVLDLGREVGHRGEWAK